MRMRRPSPLCVLRWTLALVLGFLAGGVVLHSLHGPHFDPIHLIIGLLELIGCVLLAFGKTRVGAILVGVALVGASAFYLHRGQAPPAPFFIYAAALYAVSTES